MDGDLYMWVRVLHILVAALWVGTACVLSMILMPAIRDAGSAGGKVMLSLHRRKLHVFIAAIAVLTVLSGIWLYWELTAGFEWASVSSSSGLLFGIGGLCGLLALIMGASLIGPGFARLASLVEQTDSLPEPQHPGHTQAVAALQRRTMMIARIALGLIVVALLLMASGHYV